jgi:nitroreductase
MKKKIHQLFPYLGPKIHIIVGFFYDTVKFIRTSSSLNPKKTKLKLQAILIRQYHGIEKALSLPHPRKGFGIGLIGHLMDNTEEYYRRFGYDSIVSIVLDNLSEYINFNKTYSEVPYKELELKIIKLRDLIIEYNLGVDFIGGKKEINKVDIDNVISQFNFKEFSDLRYSIRDFAKGDVSPDLIKEAVKIAMKTPSACNRQAWKVHVFKGESMAHVLNYQKGNGGFRDSINTVIMVTGLTSSFSHGERHQVWVDGGLFSMSIILAFHSLGIGSCALNTSYTYKAEKALRNAIDLPIEEEPIMMIALGLLKETFLVASSPRKDLSEIMVTH